MHLSNLNRLRIMYASHLRTTSTYALVVALAASLGCVAAPGIEYVNQAVAAQDRLPQVESMITVYLNGGALQDADGMLVNCDGVRSVKYQLTKGL